MTRFGEVLGQRLIFGMALGFILCGVAAGSGHIQVNPKGVIMTDDRGGGGFLVRDGGGACCLDSGACLETTESDCDATSGMYVGEDTACLGDSNGDDIDDACGGACCTCPVMPGEPGVCEEALLHVDCLESEGFWFGGMNCDPNPCPGVPANDDCPNATIVDLLDPDVCVNLDDGSSSGTPCVNDDDCIPLEICAGKYYDYDNHCADDDFADLGTTCGGAGDLHYDMCGTASPTRLTSGFVGCGCHRAGWWSMIR